jgi:predicted transposase YdaD
MKKNDTGKLKSKGYQIYDKTLRILFEKAIKDGEILKPYLEEYAKISVMDSVVKNPKEIRVDFINKIEPKDKPAYILQVEFQVKVDTNIPYRMLEYYQILSSKHKLEVEQILVYLGKKSETPLSDSLHHRNLQYRYRIIDLSRIPFDKMIQSDSPSEIVLSILSDYEGETPHDIFEAIDIKLHEVCENQQELKDSYLYLINLLDLRTFDNEFKKQIKAMPVTLDYKKGFLYQEGRQEGRQEERFEMAITMSILGYSIDIIS